MKRTKGAAINSYRLKCLTDKYKNDLILNQKTEWVIESMHIAQRPIRISKDIGGDFWIKIYLLFQREFLDQYEPCG